MTLIRDATGRLHVRWQVEDYALHGPEFDMMGFLTFTVETYERRMTIEHNEDRLSGRPARNQYGYYLNGHPRSGTHMQVC